MHSCLYEGHVRHRRFAPVEHAFRYALFMVYLVVNRSMNEAGERWSVSAPLGGCHEVFGQAPSGIEGHAGAGHGNAA